MEIRYATSSSQPKLFTCAGRNGAGSMTLTGAASTDTLVKVLNLTDGDDITTAFSTVGTNSITQVGGADYSAKILLVQLKPSA
mgnify:CR=1 FL=1